MLDNPAANYGIYVQGSYDIEIEAAGGLIITAGQSGIYSGGAVTVTGNLKIRSSSYGIHSDGAVTVTGDLDIQSGNYGILAWGAISLKYGTCKIIVNNAVFGLYGGGNVTLEGGSFTVESKKGTSCVYAHNTLALKSGTFDTTGGNRSFFAESDDLKIESGVTRVHCKDGDVSYPLIACKGTLTLAKGLNIVTPEGGKIDGGAIVNQNGNRAEEVLIVRADPAAQPGGILIATMNSAGANALRLDWTQVSGVDGFDVFCKECDGSEKNYRLAQSVAAGTNGVTLTGFRKGKCYKAYVRAWVKSGESRKYVLNASPVAHCIAGGVMGKTTNPAELKLKKSTLTVKLGKTARIKGSVKGQVSGKKLLQHMYKLRFLSSNSAVATVSAACKVRAKSPGSCVIYVLTNNGIFKTVNVKVDARPKKVRVAKSARTVKAGDTLDLAGLVRLTPKKAQTTLTWKSSNPSVATVDGGGRVTELSKGTTTVTVRTANGKKAKIRIKVK